MVVGLLAGTVISSTNLNLSDAFNDTAVREVLGERSVVASECSSYLRFPLEDGLEVFD